MRCSVALLPGKHDHSLLLDAVLVRCWTTAPADLLVQGVRVLVLGIHRVGLAAGALGLLQLQWLAQSLRTRSVVICPWWSPLLSTDRHR